MNFYYEFLIILLSIVTIKKISLAGYKCGRLHDSLKERGKITDKT